MARTVVYRTVKKYRVLGGGYQFRPYLDVVLRQGSNSCKTLGLVDSGADDCLFHSDLADLLGLDLTGVTPEPVGGIGGLAHARFVDVDMRVAGAQFRTLVGFTDGAPQQYGLLGREAFFARFAVGFDEVGRSVLYTRIA